MFSSDSLKPAVMKLIAGAFLFVLAVSATADTEYREINWAKVVPIEEVRGFWDGRDLRPDVNSEGMTRAGRIVGGSGVTPHSVPYQAALLITFEENCDSGSCNEVTYLCGGSIVTINSILTAAHCVYGSTQTLAIGGAHDVTTIEATQQRISVSYYNIHPAYNPINRNNDVATLRLSTPFTFTTEIQPITLASATAGTLSGSNAQVTGWGSTSGSVNTPSATLLGAQLSVITNSVCTRTYGSRIITSSICASSSIATPCTSDDGGPLTASLQGVTTQIGVYSFISPGCPVGTPAAFARVSSYRSWIDAHV